MKILVLNLRGAEPQSLFVDERLENLRRLMDLGCFGELNGSASDTQEWMHLAAQPDHTLTIWDYLQQAQKRCISIGPNKTQFVNPMDIQAEIDRQALSGESDLIKASQSNFSVLKYILETQSWDYCQLIEHGLEKLRQNIAPSSAESWLRDYYLHLDRELEAVLQKLGDDTVILVVADASADSKGSFILASSNNPLNGEHKGGSATDISPTLLELAGYPLPSGVHGKSWVAGMELNTSSSGLTAEEEEILRERLSGLGYI